MKPLLPILALAGVVFAAGCSFDDGPRTTQTRSVGDFDRVSATDGIDVELRTGDAAHVRVTAGEDVIDDIETVVDGGTLRITGDGDHVFGGERVVRITLPRLVAVEASGGSDVDGAGIRAAELRLTASGGSDLEFDGRVDRLVLTASGGSDAHLSGLDARTVTLRTSDGSDADVSAIERLDADVSGGSDVSYSGSPEITKQVSDSADFTRD
jgi:hypothetical protein